MLNNRKYHILLVPSELGCGKRGASQGPEAIMFADIERKGDFFKKYSFTRIKDFNNKLIYSTPYKFAHYIDHISEVINIIIDEVRDCFNLRKFPLILSGDHSNAIGSIAGIKNYYPAKRLGVIWIDAHGDLHSPYTTPSGNVHGMPLAASLGDEYCSEKINDIDEATKHYWEGLTHAGDKSIYPKLFPEDIVFIDIRDLEAPEWKDIRDNKMKYYGPQEIKDIPIKKIAEETLKYLDHCDIIFISFDVDSMDPSVSEGTGTSTPDGMTLGDAKELLGYLFRSPKLIAFEITEVNPLMDTKNQMAKAVLEILDHLI